MSHKKWSAETQGPRYKAHSNRFKRMRALARDITFQGTSKAAPLRDLVAQWWKLARRMDFSMREKFAPPKTDQGVFARMRAHWNDDKSQGWPDPATHRVRHVAINRPDTFRWAYRRLKRMAIA